MLYRGVFFQIFAIFIVYCFSYDLIIRLRTANDRKIGLDCVYISLTIIGGLTYARTFYSMPFWVTIDEELKTLDIKYFLRKPILISSENMLSYNDTAINVSRRSGTTIYSGFYLYLGDGRKVLLSDRNFVAEDIVYIGDGLLGREQRRGRIATATIDLFWIGLVYFKKGR